MLTQFADMSETIHSNFSQINSRLNDLENNVISAIKEEKNKEIASLKEQLAAKAKDSEKKQLASSIQSYKD